MRRMKGWLLGLVALLLLSTSLAQAATWTIVSNSDCTAFAAATGLTTANVNCCLGAKTGFCDHRGTALGTEFSRIIYAVTGATQTYTTGGDAIAAAQLTKLGFGTPVYAACNPSTAGHGVVLVRTTTLPKIQLWNGTTEQATTANAISNIAVNCVVYGH